MSQPVALDLLNVMWASKIAAELERIADYAANIAKHIGGLDMVSVEQPMESIVRMANLAREMLTDVIDAYWHSKAAKSRRGLAARRTYQSNLRRPEPILDPGTQSYSTAC